LPSVGFPAVVLAAVLRGECSQVRTSLAHERTGEHAQARRSDERDLVVLLDRCLPTFAFEHAGDRLCIVTCRRVDEVTRAARARLVASELAQTLEHAGIGIDPVRETVGLLHPPAVPGAALVNPTPRETRGL